MKCMKSKQKERKDKIQKNIESNEKKCLDKLRGNNNVVLQKKT